MTTHCVRRRLAVLTVAVTAMLLWNAPARAAEPVVSLRVFPVGAEVEVHIKSVGVLVSHLVGAEQTRVTSGGATVCEDVIDRTFFGARYFFSGPQDSWYVGGLAYSETVAKSGCGITEAESGALPIVGYHWLWDSGLNIDLGLRPGIIAVGFSF